MQSFVPASPIERITFCERLGPHPTGFEFRSTSLPGHLVHIVLSGEVQQECNGRAYRLKRGDVIWYHEDELVRGHVVKGPWIWYSAGFVARTLPPPPFEARRFRPPLVNVSRPFKEMWTAWRDARLPEDLRTLRVHAGLLRMLAALFPFAREPRAAEPHRADPRAQLWWELETKLRQNLERGIDLELMEQVSGRSQATIARACQFAVGLPPLKRIKQLRLSLARGLVQCSALSMTEIASRVGYGRVHEFSRDYRKHFGLTPTAQRKDG